MEKTYITKLSDLVEKELDQLSSKASLNPTEVCSAKEAVDLLKKMKEYKEMCEEEEMGYSERSMRGRGYSYTTPEMYNMYPMMAGNPYPMNGYQMDNDSRRINSSYGRGTWNATGQYSGHSVKDRMIDRLERMMDEAKSDYERQEIMNEINRIRQ